MRLLRSHPACSALALAACIVPTSACLVLKPQHDDLAKQVAELEQRVAREDKAAQEQLARASALAEQVEAKLKEVQEVLRRNQADLGLRVDNLELDVSGLRGDAENASFVADATNQNLNEMRQQLDARLTTLEGKLDEATNIPEGRGPLLAAAEDEFKRKNYKKARALWRTFQSRYPADPKLAEARFKIGLTHFSERDYKSALGEFYGVVQNAPDSEVVPDALYYSGLAFAQLGQCENAIAYFEAVSKRTKQAPDSYKKQAEKQIEILRKDKGELCFDKRAPDDAAAPVQGSPTAPRPRANPT
jgi:TolA-binding protein